MCVKALQECINVFPDLSDLPELVIVISSIYLGIHRGMNAVWNIVYR